MATGGDTGEITNRQYVELGRAISRPNMESIALGYLNIDQETLDSMKVKHREDIEAFNRDVLRTWAYQHAGPDQVMVSIFSILADSAYTTIQSFCVLQFFFSLLIFSYIYFSIVIYMYYFYSTNDL